MLPTRRTQPYRRGEREVSPALLAMLQGRPQFAPNPMDQRRAQQRAIRQLLKTLRV